MTHSLQQPFLEIAMQVLTGQSRELTVNSTANDHSACLFEIDGFRLLRFGYRVEPLVFSPAEASGIGAVDDFLDEPFTVDIRARIEILADIILIDPMGKHHAVGIQHKNILLAFNEASLWVGEFGQGDCASLL